MRRQGVIFVVVAAAVLAAPLEARQLTSETLKGFERYVQLTEARQAAEVDGRSPFLWIDRQPAASRSAILARLSRGEVVSARLETQDGGRSIGMGDGKVHHWIGTVLLAKVPLDRAVAFVQDYERYPQVFAPIIQRARILQKSPTRFDVAMRTMSSKYGITVVFDGDYGIDYRRLSPQRMYTKSVATNLHQVDNAGKANEQRIPGDRASRGYLWRLNTYCWFEERPEGTYEQCETVSLSSDPGWFINTLFGGIINGIPRDTLEFTLTRVRAGVS